MTGDTLTHRCPKCGARLSAERLDHHLTGQERLFCPEHGDVGSLGQMRNRNDREDWPEPDDFE